MAKLKIDLAAWEHREIGGKEATGIINEIWRTGDEEGYWSEYVFLFNITDSIVYLILLRRGALAWDATYVAASHWE